MKQIVLSLAFTGVLGCSSDYKVGAAASSYTVSPDLNDLGVVSVGETVVFTVMISHTGGAPIDIISTDVINIEGDYFGRSTAPMTKELESDGEVPVNFEYTPEGEGYHYGRIIVKTDASKDPEQVVEVRGQAANPTLTLYPSVVDFGPVAVGSSAVEKVTMVNEGTIAIEITELPVVNPVFAASLALPYRMEPGDRVEAPFNFAPDDDLEQTTDAKVVLSTGFEFSGVRLRGNACSTASGDLYDQDGDGYSVCGTDCDDSDPDARPGAEEVCNGRDDNCDGTVDEGTSCYDDDGDGQSEDEGDCNDSDPGIHLGAVEDMANGMDDDCDGVVDSGATDLDGDGFSAEGGDCAEFDSSVHPGAEERPDGIDNDCDGIVDEGTVVYDDDGDGVTEVEGDCDDTDIHVSPIAMEIADWVDNDCDGAVDEGTMYADDDGDGFSEFGGDCNDADPSRSPGYPEIEGDGIDNNCDGIAL